MLFTTPLFLFGFLPLSLIFYFITPSIHRNLILLAISMLFYFWGEPLVGFIVITSALVDVFISRKILSQERNARAWLAGGVAANLALLGIFKYADFVLVNLSPFVGALPRLNLLLPLGLSFIVFEKITYLVDIYRGTGQPAVTVRDYMLFVFLFPKMLAGPIIKYHEIEGALHSRSSPWEERAWGFLRFLWGMAKKVLIADICGNLADKIFEMAPETVGFTTAWLGVLAFTTQIYYDFSGYSDMAIGLARIFGFRLRENFNHPYGSASFTEFWRRWHISLSTWIRDYLYVPLGGNRRGRFTTSVNLWTCFLLSGLWHGASWHFVLWGAWNGLFLIADRLFWLRLTQNLPRVIPVSVTLIFVMIGWIIFRCDTLDRLYSMMLATISPGFVGDFVRVRTDQLAAIIVGLGGALIASTGTVRAITSAAERSSVGRALGALLIVSIGVLATLKIVTVTFQPFLYFRF